MPSRSAPFEGVGVALVTLFDDDGVVDAPATAELAARLVARGVRGVVVAGSTGEAAALAPDERIELLRAVRKEVPGDVALVAGTGAPSRREAVELTRAAIDHGAGAVLALSPPGDADHVGYYEAVARAAADTPVLAYHFPAASAPGIPVDVVSGLPVAGLKDSSGDAERLLDELAVLPGALYTGSSTLLAFAGPLGCAGAILALANLEPEGCAAAFAGDPDAQRALLPVHQATRGRFPRALKELVAEREGTSPVCRMG